MNKAIKFLTSNKYKLKEYQDMLLSCGLSIEAQEGQDLKEVQGDSRIVALYKSKEAGTNTLIEDTILLVKNKKGVYEEIVDIKWKIKELKNKSEAIWKVTIGFNDGDKINLVEGIIYGVVDTSKFVENSFGFDSIFIPINQSKTLLEMGEYKINYSARKLALCAFIEKNYVLSLDIKNILPWNGAYQNTTKEVKTKKKQNLIN